MNDFWKNLITSFLREFSKGNVVRQKQNRIDSNIGVAFDSGSDFQDYGFVQDSINRLSPSGIDLISNFEGLRLKAYYDQAGVCTIGFGTTVYPNGVPVQIRDQCSVEQAKSYMHHDLAHFEKVVISTVKVALTQNQFDALVSLTYNIGAGAFKNSTLLKLLNQADYIGASEQFDVWVKAGGQTVQGLVKRRAAEKAYFLK